MNLKQNAQIPKCLCDHMDGDVDTKPAFDPFKLLIKFTSSSLSIKPENYSYKGMSLRLNK